MATGKFDYEYWLEGHDGPLRISDVNELYGKKFIVRTEKMSYGFDFSILETERFHYNDSDGIRHDIDMHDFHFFDFGKEGCLLRDADKKMCIKIFHRMLMNFAMAEQLKGIPKQEGLMMLDNFIFNSSDRFAGFINPYMEPIPNLYDVKCRTFIDYYGHIYSALKVLGLDYNVLVDDILPVNFLFTDDKMLLHDPGGYAVLQGLNPKTIAASNILNFDAMIPVLYGKILTDCTRVLDGNVPIEGEGGLIEEVNDTFSKKEYFEREFGSFETFPDYLCNRFPRLVKTGRNN